VWITGLLSNPGNILHSSGDYEQADYFNNEHAVVGGN
jgi:hypothetical protein